MLQTLVRNVRHNLLSAHHWTQPHTRNLSVHKICLAKHAEKTPSTLLTSNNPEDLHPITLLDKTSVNHNTSIFSFALQSPVQTLGVPVGQHVGLQEHIDGEDIVRWYTPLNCEADSGKVDFVIKVYGKAPGHPKGGVMTQHLQHMRKGDKINVRVADPRDKIQYMGRGDFMITNLKSTPRHLHGIKKVNMVAGGSGLAPMLQLLRAKARNADREDNFNISLLFANQKEEDIMMREELEKLHKQGVLNKLWYTVDNAPAGWKFSTGLVSAEMLKEHFFPPAEDTLTLMCGRMEMMLDLVRPLVLSLNYTNIFKY